MQKEALGAGPSLRLARSSVEAPLHASLLIPDVERFGGDLTLEIKDAVRPFPGVYENCVQKDWC